MHGVLEINISEPGHAKNCSFAITNVCCKVFGFALAGITGYRSIDCTAVLNPFAFVTVLVLTISEQYEYSDPLKDQTRPVATLTIAVSLAFVLKPAFTICDRAIHVRPRYYKRMAVFN